MLHISAKKKKCIYGTTSLHLPETRLKKLVLLSSGPCPHYMMILFAIWEKYVFVIQIKMFTIGKGMH